MWPRLSIVAGLVAGVAVAVLVLGGIVAFAPDPVPAATPVPSVVPSVAAPSPSPGSSGRRLRLARRRAAPARPTALAFHIGEPAPPLVVPQVGGGTIDLANLKGQPVWVNFMGTYCPPCVDEFPLMNGFAARYADTGLVVLAIDVKEEEGVVAAFAEGLGATFPLGLDSDGSAAGRVGRGRPAGALLDRQGRHRPRRGARRHRAGRHGRAASRPSCRTSPSRP